MGWSLRIVLFTAAACVCPPILSAQFTAQIVANDNRVAAGNIENGVLRVALEIRDAVWHAEADDGGTLFVEAFGERGKPAQIPGPLLRVPTDTTVHVTITNTLKIPATVFGFVTRPAKSDPGLEIAANQTREITFSAGAPGTYFYWARSTPPEGMFPRPRLADAQLNGAFIVDPPGPIPADRVVVMNFMRVPADILHPAFDVPSMNGKEFPFTERLQYQMGDTIRWRVINPGLIDHPMHLHGAFYKIVSLGDADQETQYTPDERQSVVTHDMLPGGTMMLEWTPSHPGRWLFHCHYLIHVAPDMRVPLYDRRLADAYRGPQHVAGMPAAADPKDSMSNMAGMVIIVDVKAKPGAAAEQVVEHPRKIELVLQPDSPDGKSKLVSCSIREGGNIASSRDRSAGPPLVLTQDQPVEITVINHLKDSTTIHWHGLELNSYFDGVMGGGMGEQITPDIPPGGSFVVHFTPNRAGTFIYHTHVSSPEQLAGGTYGAIIVLAPGQKYEPAREQLIVIGSRDAGLLAKRITVNGSETLPEMSLQHGVDYRVRVVNIAPDLEADLMLGSKTDPVTWREIAKDGALVPARLANPTNAMVRIVSGETYDFELRPDKSGDMPVEVVNWINKAKLAGNITVH